jgi:hypothetical protein
MKIPAFLSLAALAAGAAVASVAVFVAPAACAEDDAAVNQAIADFKEYLKGNPESQGIRNKVADLSLKHHPAVADALLPLLQGPKYDDDVKIAVAQNIGKQGKPEIAGLLASMADDKKISKEKPKLLAALLEGIGDANAKGQYKFLLDTGKKYLDISADVASAAFRGLSNHVTADTVDDLIKELERSDYTTTKDSPQKRAARNGTKPILNDLLRKITNKDINDVKIWKEWWSDNKKTWKPPIPGKDTGAKDINKSDTFADDAYAFEVKKPSRAWSFRKPEGSGSLYLSLEALDEGQRAAWCELYIIGTKNYKEKTPEQYAKAIRDQLEPKFRDIKDAQWEKKGTCAGRKSVEHVVVGSHKDFQAIHMHNVFVDESEVVYYWICMFQSGKPAALKEDIEEILKSFKIKR